MKKVYVGLSGGVDSAVSAALLKEQGYDVTGVFIKIWSPEFIECTWRDDRLDAMRAAVHLGIAFEEIDLSDAYRDSIITKMVSEYEKGVTPNPDVMCNSVIKFGAFYDWARSRGADIVATGHYAQVREENGKYILQRGIDTSKDQSYFIYELDQQHLAHVLFPVGGLRKPDVRAYAAAHRLPVAQKPDSQGLCFVGDISLQEFLSRFIALNKGTVLAVDGEVLGEHDGAALYTLGQRHGFRIFTTAAKSPLFVTDVNVQTNTITVSPDKHRADKIEITLSNVTWTDTGRNELFRALVQTRYREVPVNATIAPKSNMLHVTFDTPHLCSRGQSAVIYDGNTVVGGGIIS